MLTIRAAKLHPAPSSHAPQAHQPHGLLLSHGTHAQAKGHDRLLRLHNELSTFGKLRLDKMSRESLRAKQWAMSQASGHAWHLRVRRMQMTLQKLLENRLRMTLLQALQAPAGNTEASALRPLHIQGVSMSRYGNHVVLHAHPEVCMSSSNVSKGLLAIMPAMQAMCLHVLAPCYEPMDSNPSSL